MGRATQAPGQFYGYSIQVTRMLARLLQCRTGQAVSLEVLDDVAVIGPDGTTAEQSKSGLAHNPIADRAVDLWKTLCNWVGAIRRGALSSDTHFVLYVAQPHDGCLVRKLHEATGQPAALALIRELRGDMWGPAPGYPKKKHLPDTLAPFVNTVLETTDDVLIRLIVSFELETGSGSPGDDLQEALLQKAISKSAVVDVVIFLLGWVKATVDKLIEQGRPAVITWEEFNSRLLAAAKKFDRSQSLAPTPTEISDADVKRELQDRVYVRQLELIDAKERELVRAVNDYLCAASDRTSWRRARGCARTEP